MPFFPFYCFCSELNERERILSQSLFFLSSVHCALSSLLHFLFSLVRLFLFGWRLLFVFNFSLCLRCISLIGKDYLLHITFASGFCVWKSDGRDRSVVAFAWHDGRLLCSGAQFTCFHSLLCFARVYKNERLLLFKAPGANRLSSAPSNVPILLNGMRRAWRSEDVNTVHCRRTE